MSYLMGEKMYNFDVEKVTNECIKWIRDWFDRVNPNGKAVIGISGGKDSTVVAALCVKALGKDRVFGVLMPNGVQKDISDAYKVVKYLGIKYQECNILKAYNGICEACGEITPSEQAMINLSPRLRMATLYFVAQSINGIVANTCNLSEDHVGYSTLYGDMAGSFSPLGRLTVTEVKAIGVYLGLPIELIEKTPSDGLCGKTDEDNLGFPYSVLDKYLRTGKIDNVEYKNKIDTFYKKNKFKLNMLHIDTFCPNIDIVITH